MLIMIAPLVLLSATLMLSPDGPGAPSRELQRLAADARNADLRGHWDGLTRAHAAIAALPAPSAGRAWIEYYLGYVDWRQSSLAFMGEGMPGVAACLRNAQEHLTRALDAAPAFTEARLLLVIVDGGTMNADPSRIPQLGPRVGANFRQVIAEAPDNPRVKYLQAFMGFYVPGHTRAEKDAALVSWRQAAESFPKRPPANEPEWGRAEAWAWLGGTLLADGKRDQAKDALEHAIADRKDFWWARDIALPQAARSRTSHPNQ
jgi:tetratricopeptide (TPR) repeat protein